MNTVTYDTFFPEVIPHVMGCPEIVALNAVRNTVIDFCTETWFWLHVCYPQPGVAHVGSYDPDLPQNTKMVGQIDIWYDGLVMRPANEPMLRNIYWFQNPFDMEGNPRFYVTPDSNTIRLVPIPNAPSQFAGIEMTIAVAPLRASTSCWDQIYERYAETIAKGAIARLQAQLDQPWANAQNAVVLQKLYEYDRSIAKMWVQRNKTRGAAMIRFQGTTY